MSTTMAFTTACWQSRADGWRLALAGFLLAWTALAWTAEIEVSNPQLTAVDDGYVVSADFALEFNSRLEEAVARGVVLYFVLDFEMSRPRWYWFDEKVLTRSQTYRLSYHALTRQYRLANGALHQSFDNLGDALRMLSRLRNWLVVERGDAKAGERGGEKGGDKGERPLPRAGETYLVALRMRLDLTQLPKPFQIAALGNKDWTLASDWKNWTMTLPAEAK